MNLDKLTYAGNLENLRDIESDPRYRFAHLDICDAPAVTRLLAEDEADAIVHFAAESMWTAASSGRERSLRQAARHVHAAGGSAGGQTQPVRPRVDR